MREGDVFYEFDFSKLTLKDYLLCVEIAHDYTSNEAYRAFLHLLEKTCVGFDTIPLSEIRVVQQQFVKRLDAHFANLLTIEGFMDTIAGGEEESEDGRQE